MVTLKIGDLYRLKFRGTFPAWNADMTKTYHIPSDSLVLYVGEAFETKIDGQIEAEYGFYIVWNIKVIISKQFIQPL